MRFPLALTAKIAAHIIKHKVRRTPRFAMVLQLEPLHTCNLTCTGCGRIREYSTSLKDMVPLDQCLAAAKECDAPMVSICGGEPLIYPKIEELVAGILNQGRIVALGTPSGTIPGANGPVRVAPDPAALRQIAAEALGVPLERVEISADDTDQAPAGTQLGSTSEAMARRLAARAARTHKGLLIVYTGQGKGKTTAALGMLLRAWGREMRVGGVQFFKHTNATFGELRALAKMQVELTPMGDGFTWNTQDREQDMATARRAWERRAAEMPRAEGPDEVTWGELRRVLDEEVAALKVFRKFAEALGGGAFEADVNAHFFPCANSGSNPDGFRWTRADARIGGDSDEQSLGH